MVKWFIAFTLALALLGWLTPLLRKVGLGRLPGDINVTFSGREYSFPLASSLLLSALVTWLMYAFR